MPFLRLAYVAFISASMSAVGCSSASSGSSVSDAAGHDDAATHEPDAATSRDAARDAVRETGIEAGASPGEAGTSVPDASTTPISAPDDQWTWVDFPGSKCASGTPTGIAVNPHAGATELLIYFEGGGECHDATSCWGASPTANNLAEYDATTFAAQRQQKYPALVRTTPGNPFSAMNMAYVPYCTGDLHIGTVEVDLQVNGSAKPTYFWGAIDLELFLARLAPTFTGQTRVYSFGTSAGGFSSYLNYDRVARAFGGRVDIIDDSGPPFPATGTTNNSGAFAGWGFVAPAGCSPCNSYRDVLDFDRSSQPQSKFAFLSFAEDTVISKDFGYTLTNYPAAISTFSMSLSSDPNAATFVVTNEQSHVVESDGTLAPQYLPWMTQLVNDDPAWKDTTYADP